MRFFFDNCLAPKHAKALDALVVPDHQVIHLRDRFAANTPDEQWLRKLGEEEDWVLVSGDHRIIKTRHLRAIWRACRVTGFFLKPAWMDQPLMNQHARLASCFSKIIVAAESHPKGTGFTVGLGGKIEIIR